jgi:hypothetical protein
MVKCLESQEPKTATNGTSHKNEAISNINGAVDGENEDDDEWKEVGKKNRAFVTRRVSLFLR